MTTGGSTPVHAIPWPDGAGAADGSLHMKNIADAVERELVEHDTALAALDTAYLNVVGDTATGKILLPTTDQSHLTVVPTEAVTAGYVDQIVTVSDQPASGIPARDGLFWVRVTP